MLNLKTAWPTKILMTILSSSDNFLSDKYIIFQRRVDIIETAHDTYSY